ncbi:hypothetical protein DFJ77DRAFT_218093 [Powellomyces hirtus]|nr:hypothetical protein DFJ77DRAFT_218093 [Powellomyces hirtus]
MADNSIAPAESSAAPPLLDPPSKSSEDSAISLPLPESDDKPTRLDTTLLRGSPVQSPTEPASTTTSTDATAIPDTGPMPTKRPEPPSRTPSPEPQSPSKIVADTDLATRSTKRSKHDRNDRARHGPKTVEIVADDDEHEIARKEALKSLTDIEHEFAKFREKMYQEKMAETEAEVAAVENGTHPLLVSQMVDIEQRKQDRLAAAGARLRQEEISFQRQFEAAVAQAHTDFIVSFPWSTLSVSLVACGLLRVVDQ